MSEESFAMPDLEAITLEITNQEKELAEKKRKRNIIMKKLINNGTSKSKVAQSGKISRQALYKILLDDNQ